MSQRSPSRFPRHLRATVVCRFYISFSQIDLLLELLISLNPLEDNEDGSLLQGAHEGRCKGPRRARVHTCGPRSPADDSQS